MSKALSAAVFVATSSLRMPLGRYPSSRAGPRASPAANLVAGRHLAQCLRHAGHRLCGRNDIDVEVVVASVGVNSGVLWMHGGDTGNAQAGGYCVAAMH